MLHTKWLSKLILLIDGLVGVDLSPQTSLSVLPADPSLGLIDVPFPLGDDPEHQEDEEGSQSKEHCPHPPVGASIP